MKTGGGSLLPLVVFANVGGTYAEGLDIVLPVASAASISPGDACALRLKHQHINTQHAASTTPAAAKSVEFGSSLGCPVSFIDAGVDSDPGPGAAPCLGGDRGEGVGWGEGVGSGAAVGGGTFGAGGGGGGGNVVGGGGGDGVGSGVGDSGGGELVSSAIDAVIVNVP